MRSHAEQMTRELPKDVVEALRRNDWFGARVNLERHEDAEREEALCEHEKAWSELLAKFRAECEKTGGHEFEDLPNNGWNRPHRLIGQWPRACRKCGMREPSPNVADQPTRSP